MIRDYFLALLVLDISLCSFIMFLDNTIDPPTSPQ